MKLAFLVLVLLVVVGCSGKDFSGYQPAVSSLEASVDQDSAQPPLEASGSDSQPDEPDGGPEADQGAPEAATEPVPDGSEPELEPEPGSEPEPEAGPDAPDTEACIPDNCVQHPEQTCGWLDDGCGGAELCGEPFVWLGGNKDLQCQAIAAPGFAWSCGTTGQQKPGPAPMPGCLWTAPSTDMWLWCCPKSAP